jgi:hypothetical protein
MVDESSTEVPCPECPGILSPETIRRYADTRTRERYDVLCLNRMMQEDEEFTWVFVPNFVQNHIALLTMIT